MSQWIKKGWISLGPDGLLDPVQATRQLLAHADPSRLRARIFREATASMGELRARVQSLESEVAAERATLEGYEARLRYYIHQDELYVRACAFVAAIATDIDGLVTAHLQGMGEDWLDFQAGRHLFQQDDAELRELWAYASDSRETPLTQEDESDHVE